MNCSSTEVERRLLPDVARRLETFGQLSVSRRLLFVDFLISLVDESSFEVDARWRLIRRTKTSNNSD